MRKWTVRELERIESDIEMMAWMISDDREIGVPEYHAEWLRERVEIREQHSMSDYRRCDGCSNETAQIVVTIVDEYHDEMGAPSNLGISYVCRYHVRNNY